MGVLNPAGNESSFNNEASVDLPSKHRVALTLEGSDAASSDRDGDGKSSSGDEVTFIMTVNNTGSVDLTDVVVQAAELEGLVCQQFAPSTIGKRCNGASMTPIRPFRIVSSLKRVCSPPIA